MKHRSLLSLLIAVGCSTSIAFAEPQVPQSALELLRNETWLRQVVKPKSYSASANYMSKMNYIRWRLYKETGAWLTKRQVQSVLFPGPRPLSEFRQPNSGTP
jgi:hypothetical protein